MNTPLSVAAPLILALASLLAGCTPRATLGDTTAAAAPAPVVVRAASDNWPEAARRYYQRAQEADAPARHDYLLRAAQALEQAGRLAEAREVLHQLDPARLDRPLLIRRQLQLAALALAEGRGQPALEALRPLESQPPAEPAQHLHYRELRAEALEATGQLPESIQQRLELDQALSDPIVQRANRERLRTAVAKLFEPLHIDLATAMPGEITRLAPPLQSLAIALRQRFPAEYGLAPARTTSAPGAAATGPAPARIALLLPLSGSLARAGEAVREGFMAAYFATEGERPEVRVYDTASEIDTAWTQYQKAVQEGAQVVVGPLNKAAVGFFAGRPELPVPTLGLNTAQSATAPANLYQFGLSPEDEAAEVAQRAWQEGHRRAVILAPDSAWGQRVAAAFRLYWERLGGQIAEEQTYSADGSDFSEPIRRALNLDGSEARHRELEKLLGRNLGFTPRRRQDVDFIFMAAFPREARQIRPQLKFHYAGTLPVYATSHIFGGAVATKDDQDLDGVIFGDMPWVLDTDSDNPVRQALQRQRGNGGEAQWRLYAFGADAFRLGRQLPQLAPDSAPIAGDTGELSVDDERHVYRRLRWAQFRGGVPRPTD